MRWPVVGAFKSLFDIKPWNRRIYTQQFEQHWRPAQLLFFLTALMPPMLFGMRMWGEGVGGSGTFDPISYCFQNGFERKERNL